MNERRRAFRGRRPSPRSASGAGVALVLSALAILVLVGSTVLAPQPTPVPPVAEASPAAAEPSPSVAASSAPPASAEPSAVPTAAPEETPPVTPLPSFALATPLDEYYPTIAPSTPIPDDAATLGSEGGDDGDDGDGADDGEGDDSEATGGTGAVLTTAGNGRATRVVVPSLRIDLPVVAGDLKVRGNRRNYPLCDVAQYMMEFGQPGQVGTAYIYAHAQRGMFLPMLRASRRNGGRAMIGERVEVYTSDLKLHVYEIVRVKRHSTDLKIAFRVGAGEHQLVLQTSEGPPGHRPVLQVAAKPVSVVGTTAARAMPNAKPRACLPR